MHTRNYRDLFVWQKSILLVNEVYKLTVYFPNLERYGLVSQMRRAAVSIPSNIAEGGQRSTFKEYKYFLHIAFGSGAELETLLEICKSQPFGQELVLKNLEDLLEEVMKMLNKMTH